ncbi:SprT-like family-domain-containing protein [Colletotrichum lupini]|nr:SprT-like family-domain-containing protein [Colletotrichum lupini]
MTGYVDFASSSEDEFPDLDAVLQRSKQFRRPTKAPAQTTTNSIDSDDDASPSRQLEEEALQWNASSSKDSDAGKSTVKAAPPTVRRRKLGARVDNPLLRPFGIFSRNEGQNLFDIPVKSKEVPRVGVRELRVRSRDETPTGNLSSKSDDESDGSTNEQTEITEADISEFFGDSASEFEDDGTPTLFGHDSTASRARGPVSGHSQETTAPRQKERQPVTKPAPEIDFPDSRPSRPQKTTKAKERSTGSVPGRKTIRPQSAIVDLTDDMADALRRLDITAEPPKKQGRARKYDTPPKTPPLTPPRPFTKSLISPKKLPGIPKTPHGPGMDMFWSQEFVDEWNEEHSPKKLILPPAQRSPAKSPKKAKEQKTNTANRKESKKAFEQRKHDIAQTFLQELDDTITQGKLQSLAESTGGVKIQWSAKLNTTAGRANWRRETVRTKNADGSEKSVTHKHHASIELAEKVIDDENRLLNVVAHEFCHLANFMVNGITGNPHGKEFKIWAVKCSQRFGDRGIEVTTKHSYEIDFKYMWECTECGLEYKRHSKSINPERHRCGSCKAQLKQTKPTPRAAGKPSEYQQFFKEQMKVVKKEHPGSQQKEVMKIIAERWAKRGGSARATPDSEADVNKVGSQLVDLTL